MSDFQLVDIKDSSTIVIVAKRNEGKSVMAKWLLRSLVAQQKVENIYLFSPTEKLSHSFNCVPDSHIIPTFDLKFINSIIDAQTKICKKKGKDDPSVSKILLIFDDMLGSVKQGSLEQLMLNKLFATSRHLKIGLMVLSQTSRGLFSPALRQNTDMLLVRKVNDGQLPTIYESIYYPGSYKAFLEFYHNTTAASKFGFLLYDNLTREDDKFFLIAAELCEFTIKYQAKGKADKAVNKAGKEKLVIKK